MKQKISDYSPLFGDLLSRQSLRIDDREDGRSVLSFLGYKVEGSRPILERVRDGIIRNGGPQRVQFFKR